MWTKVRIRFHAHHIAGGARSILDPAGCGPDVAEVEDIPALNQVEVRVTMAATDPRLAMLCQLLEQHGEKWIEYRDDVYSDEELDQARLLVLESGAQVFGGPRVGTEYDMTDACPVCGSGARQRSAQMIDAKGVLLLKRSRAASTYYSDILVNEKLAKQLAGSGISGLSFHDVCAVRKDGSRAGLSWRQLHAGHTLPPISPASTGVLRDSLCRRCGRSGFETRMSTPMRLAYRARDLEQAEDVNVTWEWFGPWSFDGQVSKALFSYPKMLVTPRVWRVFRDAGVTSFDWLPIRVDDSGE